MSAPLYLLEHIVQRFGERQILSIDRLEFVGGEIYGLLGPNGAGKTSLMKILGFLDRPCSGKIFFKGNEVLPEDAGRLRSKVVWVPQSPVMFTGTVLYNVAYPLRIKGASPAVQRERAIGLLKEVRLDHMADAPAANLSGGEAQRVSAARALAAGAEVILFDEPTANLDYQARQEMQDLIQRLWFEKNLSLVITTHDVRLAKELCRKVVTLDDGSISSRLFLPVDDAIPGDITCMEGKPTLSHSHHTLTQTRTGRVIGLEKKGITVHLSIDTDRGVFTFVINYADEREFVHSLTIDTTISLCFIPE